MITTILVYSIAVYGITNMMVHSNGPLYLFKGIRTATHRLHPAIGELFSCIMCFSTWVGLAFSLIDTLVLTSSSITPSSLLMSGESMWATTLFDMFFSSGSCWLIHQFEELMERTNPAYYEE